MGRERISMSIPLNSQIDLPIWILYLNNSGIRFSLLNYSALTSSCSDGSPRSSKARKGSEHTRVAEGMVYLPN
jgi:hypothetical protein